MKGIELGAQEALWITAALNAKIQDRRMERSALRPVQRLSSRNISPISYFDDFGVLGMSALACCDRDHLYFSSGDDLHRLDTSDGALLPIAVSGLSDVHELSLIDDALWLANTGADEAVQLDLRSGVLRQRIALAAFREKTPSQDDQADTRQVDRFHCNQIFLGLDGDRYALVHHVSGLQFLHKIAERLIKAHGHGGVLNLDRGTSVPLGLKAPHSVRVVEDRYFVCDSGASCIRVYDRNWKFLGAFETRGFGRGAVWSEQTRLYYVGISATRTRYLGVHRGPSDCRIQTFSIDDWELRGEISLPRAEQISNLYLLPKNLTLDHIPRQEPPRMALA